MEIEKNSWCCIFRGSHLIGGYSTILDYRMLKITSSCLESRPWFDLYLGRNIKNNCKIIILEVRILPKIEGVAYLEGHLKLNKYGTCV